MPKKTKNNLIPIKDSARAKELGRRGGIKTKIRKERIYMLKQLAESMLKAAPNSKIMEKISEFCPEMATQNATMALAMIVALAKESVESGNVRATELLSRFAGQGPETSIDIKSDGKALQQCVAIIPSEQSLEEWLSKNSK
jgi:hypothetical protein